MSVTASADSVAEMLEKYFDTAFSAPEGIKKLRELILTLAMQGKLVPQDPNDQPASELLKEIEAEKQRLVKEGKIKKKKSLPPIKPEEMPYELPQGWEWVRFGNLVQVLNGRAFKQNELLESGIPVLRVGNLFTSNKWYYSDLVLDEDKYIEKGDLIYAWSASFGPFIWGGDRVIYHYHIWKVKFFITDFPEKKYLYDYLLEATDRIKSSGSGIAMLHMTKDGMEKMIVPLPPFSEQRRIVAKIDQLMARCDELEKLREEREKKQITVHTSAIKELLDAKNEKSLADAWQFLKRNFNELYSVKENVTELRKAILQLAVMGKLVPQDPNDPPASELLKEIEAEKQRLLKESKIKKQKPLPPIKPEEVPYELPQGWEWVRLANIVLSITGGGTPSKNNSSYWGGDIPWASVKDLNVDVYLDSTIDTITAKAIEKSSTSLIPKGKIIVCTRMGLGKIVINNIDVAINQDLKALDVSSFVNQMFFFNKYKEYKITGSGMTVKGIRQDELLNFLFPLPPIDEQHRIVAKIDQLMALCDTLDQQIDAATRKQTELLNSVITQV